MAKLIYSMIISFDGYISDEQGNFDWGVPDEEVHTFINDLERSISTYLYGRRMYEMMVGWEAEPLLATQSIYTQDYAQIWQAANKVVYSKTLRKVSSSKTRIEQNFDPASIENLKLNSESDLSIGGPELATAAFRAGLVDECHMFVAPVVVGLGKKAMPFNFQLQLDLIEERRFGNGMVYLRYIIKG